MDMPLITSPQRKFDGGLNLHDADVDISYSELLVFNNARLKGKSAITAPSFSKYSTTQLSGKIKHIWGDFLGATARLIVAAGQNIYSANSGTYTSLLGSLDLTAEVDMDRYSNRLFIGSTVDAPKKIDSLLAISNHGVVAPGNPASLSEVNPGVGVFPNGAYGIYITFYDSTHVVESNPNATEQTITIAAGPSNIRVNTFPSTTDTNVNKYRIYITELNGAGVWYRVAEIDYATYVGTNYTITTDDLGVELEFDNNLPSNYSLVEYFDNSLFVVYNTTKTFVNFSKKFRPEQFPLQFRNGIGDNSDETIRALVKFYSYLIIGTNEGFWVLDKHPLDGGYPKCLTKAVGLAGRNSYAIVDNSFVFVGTDGKIYSLDPTTFNNTDVRPEYVSRKIEPLIDVVNKDSLQITAGVYHHYNGNDEILFSYPAGTSTYNDTVFHISRQNGAIGTDGRRCECFGVVTDANNNKKLYHGDHVGYVWVNDSGSGYGANETGTSSGGSSVNTLRDEDIVEIMSTATSGGATSLTDTSLSMTVNEYIGEQIYIHAGTGSGQYRTIVSNTVDTFTVLAWGVVPDATSQYVVGGWIENMLNGVDLTIIDGTGAEQKRIISSHTPFVATVLTNWNTTPDSTSEYVIGGIDFNVQTAPDAYTDPADYTKRGWYMQVGTESSGNYDIEYSYTRDTSYGDAEEITIPLFNAGYLYGYSYWGSAYWGIVGSFTYTVQFNDQTEYFQRLQHCFRNRYPDQPVRINYVTTTYQNKGMFLNNT